MAEVGSIGPLLPLLSALVLGTAFGFLCGLIPGLGGRVGLIVAMPLAGFWDAYPAAVFLFSMHAVIHTSSSIPAIAFALPTSGADAATVLDGYPLARMGRAGEALGASLSASAIGGVLGALAFVAAVPVARPIVSSFGPPEFLVLSIVGISLISAVSREGMLQGLAVACIGVLCAMVGLDIRTGEPRLTFDLAELWDGLDLPALVTGLFVIPEMLAATRFSDEAAHGLARSTRLSDVLKGMFVTLRYRMILVRSTIYGIVVGLMPGLGASISVWLSYAYAARTTRSEIPFGQGAIAGVVAPEAANNAKEGGAMIPTLFFGIPGSSSMAIMMAALALAGVTVGPRMLNEDISLTYILGGTVVLANLIAIPIFFLAVPWIVRLSAVKREMIAPFAIAIGVTASLIHALNMVTHLQLLFAAILGVALKSANWPRAPFILGFVVGDLLETSFYQTAVIYGWSALGRPMTITLIALLVCWLAYLMVKRRGQRRSAQERPNPLAALVLLALFGIAALTMWRADIASSLPVFFASGLGVLLCGIVLALDATAIADRAGGERLQHVWLAGGLIVAVPFIGLMAASALFVMAVLLRLRVKAWHAAAAALLFAGLQFALVTLVLDVAVEREILGRALWLLLGR